jgi:hypothetical protein
MSVPGTERRSRPGVVGDPGKAPGRSLTFLVEHGLDGGGIGFGDGKHGLILGLSHPAGQVPGLCMSEATSNHYRIYTRVTDMTAPVG